MVLETASPAWADVLFQEDLVLFNMDHSFQRNHLWLSLGSPKFEAHSIYFFQLTRVVLQMIRNGCVYGQMDDANLLGHSYSFLLMIPTNNSY